MEEKIEKLKAGILAELPQVPFIIDQVSDAVDWCVEEHDPGIIVKLLETSLDVARYVKEISDPNFYKTHLVIASLIADIPNVIEDERFKKFQTASGAVEKSVKNVIVDPDLLVERGCFNSLNIHLTQLQKIDENCLVIMLYGILHDLKEITSGLKSTCAKSPITPQDYITVLGYAYVMSNLRMARLPLADRTKVIINNIQIILNTEVIY